MIHWLEENSEGRVLISEIERSSCGTDKEKEEETKAIKEKSFEEQKLEIEWN